MNWEPCCTHTTTPQYSSRLRIRLTVYLQAILALTCLGSASVFAQEQYDLEDGQWEKQAALDPATPQGQLQTIRQALAQDDGERAGELIDQWIESHPEHALGSQAHLLRGDTRVAQQHYFESLFDYEHVIRQYPASLEFQEALEREYNLAKLFASGVKRRLWGMRFLSAAGEAEEIFIRIQERSPGSELGELASIALGDFYFDRAQMVSAAEAYQLFLDNYPRSEHVQRAMLQLIRTNLATFKGSAFDPTGLIEAAQRIKTFGDRFPVAAERAGTDALLVRIDESLASKMLYTAQWYQKRGRRIGAIHTYRRIIKDYPRTAMAQTAIDRLADLRSTVQKQAVLGDKTPADGNPKDRQETHP